MLRIHLNLTCVSQIKSKINLSHVTEMYTHFYTISRWNKINNLHLYNGAIIIYSRQNLLFFDWHFFFCLLAHRSPGGKEKRRQQQWTRNKKRQHKENIIISAKMFIFHMYSWCVCGCVCDRSIVAVDNLISLRNCQHCLYITHIQYTALLYARAHRPKTIKQNNNVTDVPKHTKTPHITRKLNTKKREI